MKFATIALLLVGLVTASNAALAQAMNADDLKWINQCVADNKGGAISLSDEVGKITGLKNGRAGPPPRQS